MVHQSSDGKCVKSAIDREVLYRSGITSVGADGNSETTVSFCGAVMPSSITRLSLDSLVFPAVLPIGRLCRPPNRSPYRPTFVHCISASPLARSSSFWRSIRSVVSRFTSLFLFGFATTLACLGFSGCWEKGGSITGSLAARGFSFFLRNPNTILMDEIIALFEISGVYLYKFNFAFGCRTQIMMPAGPGRPARRRDWQGM